jgi:hypothetical protein
MSAERPCESCRQVITDDPTGLCVDCMTDVESEKPGSITEGQRLALAGTLGWLGITTSHLRGIFISEAISGWQHGGDLGWLSQRQASEVLAAAREAARDGVR